VQTWRRQRSPPLAPAARGENTIKNNKKEQKPYPQTLTSSMEQTSPLAMTGTETQSLTSLMRSKLTGSARWCTVPATHQIHSVLFLKI
jgi:hypothetical protein